MMKFTLLLVLSAASYHASAEVLSLTVENFAEKTAGKTVFIKCFAPWCGHCKSMAGDWEKLAADWKDHEVGLVAEIDCTTETGSPLCEQFHVEGFPTLVYGDPADADQYQGGRDYESLSEFDKENISKPICSIQNIDVCSDEEQTTIKELQGKTEEELLALNEDYKSKMDAAQTKIDKVIEELTEKYEASMKEYEADTSTIQKETNNKWVRQVLLDKGVELEDDFEDDEDGMSDEF